MASADDDCIDLFVHSDLLKLAVTCFDPAETFWERPPLRGQTWRGQGEFTIEFHSPPLELVASIVPNVHRRACLAVDPPHHGVRLHRAIPRRSGQWHPSPIVSWFR